MLAVNAPVHWDGRAVTYKRQPNGMLDFIDPEHSLWDFVTKRPWDQYRLGLFENPNSWKIGTQG